VSLSPCCKYYAMEEKHTEAAGQFEIHAFGKEGIIRCTGNVILILSGFTKNIIIANRLST